MSQLTDVAIDIYLSDQWRVHGGPNTWSCREELRDRFLPVVIQAFGSVDACLDLLLKESPYSNGHRVSNLLRACELFCLRMHREAIEAREPARAEAFTALAARFHDLSEREQRMFCHAVPENDTICALLRTDVCQLPAATDEFVRTEADPLPLGENATDASPSLAEPDDDSDVAASAASREMPIFSLEEQRREALANYTGQWACSDATVARTAMVDPADLSKWKRGLLPSKSDKKARIEKVLNNHTPPKIPKPRNNRDVKSPTLAIHNANAPRLIAHGPEWHDRP